MRAMQLEIPQEVMLSLKMPPQFMRQQLLAISLYANEYLGFGKARKLAGLSTWEFAEQLGRRGILRHYNDDDLEEDFRFAHEA